MSTLHNQVNEDLKNAMRNKQELELSTLRMLIAALKNKKIALGGGTNVDELTDEQFIETVATEIKKRKDSKEAYEQGGRQDLADKEIAEIKILEKYMPAQLSDEEIEAAVKDVVSSIGEVTQADFGKVMGQAIGKLKGRADGGKVTEIVKKVLAK
ncbi:MAG: glutamyl-tRNA(Gln) amidotransferase subunit E [Parcubacteria group bacterium ADurb.Bin316]|nr:MAG: glutamyl-tRNA(Gln) amidotransferase subunit E [Parcubacteria group bacterium ADurb.Bin316]HOZ56212.1 GatB/YqeY domain-containing protein [bacterium]